MAKSGWMAAYPRTRRPTDAVHAQLQQTISDIRNASLLGALTQPPAPQGVQKAVEDYTEKVVREALEARRPGSDPVKERLAEHLDTLVTAKAVKALADDTPAAPSPNSTTEVVEAAKAMSQIYHDSAQMALDERDRALQDKEAMEQSVGAAMERARQEEADKYRMILEIVNQGWTTQLEAVKQLSASQLELVKTQYEQQLAALQAQHQRTLDEIKGLVGSALKAKDDQLALAQQAFEQQKEMLETKYKYVLDLKDKELEAKLATAQSQSVPPWEVTYRQGMAELLLEEKRTEMQDKHHKALADQQVKDALADTLKSAKEWLPDVLQLAFGGRPGSVPMKNGIPGQRPTAGLPAGTPASQPSSAPGADNPAMPAGVTPLPTNRGTNHARVG